MNNTTTTTTKTCMAAGTAKVETALTINWDNMSNDEIRALAQQSIVIKIQTAWRKSAIPASATINAVDYKIGTRAARVAPSVESLFAAMSPDERAAFIAAHS